jgi:tRNA1(Val) A37 N6-methylase TrmN6
MDAINVSIPRFDLPGNTIEIICDLIEPKFGEHILDPACGAGCFLIHAYKYAAQHQSEANDTPLRTNDIHLYGCDFDLDIMRICQENLRNNNIENAYLKHIDLPPVNLEKQLINLIGTQFDVILTSPPFTLKQKEETTKQRHSNNTDGDEQQQRTYIHKLDKELVKLTLYLLCDGGRAAFVLPEGFLFASAYRKLRKQLVDEHQLNTIISLPRGAILSTPTTKCTVLLFRKRLQTELVQFYELEDNYLKRITKADKSQIQENGYSLNPQDYAYEPSKVIDYVPLIKRQLRAVEQALHLILQVEMDTSLQNLKSYLFDDSVQEEIHWEIRPLKNLAELKQTKSQKCGKTPASGNKWGQLRADAVSKGLFLPEANREFLAEKLPTKDQIQYQIRPGYVLINLANDKKHIGTSAIVRSVSGSLVPGDKLWLVIPDIKVTNAYFLYILLNLPIIREQIREQAPRGTIPSMLRLSKKQFLELVVAVPSMYIQHKFQESIEQLWQTVLDPYISISSNHEVLQDLLSQIFNGTLTTQWWLEHKKLLKRI